MERYADTGTGSKPKTAATKPSGAPLHLNSKPSTTSTRTTPKVEKPGLARSGGITRQTDTGTGGEALKRRAQTQQDIRLDRARDEAAQRVETGKEQLRATRERLGQQTFEENGYESRKERESRAPRSSGSKGSRSSGKRENTGSTSMTGKEYLEYVYEAKKRQQEQDVEAVRAIDSYKRNRYLVGLDVGQAEKELAQLEDWLDKGVNTERRRWDLNAAYNNGGRDGETYQAALAQYGQAAAEAEETKAKIAQLKQDIEQAKSAQYYEKGVAALDNVKKYHYNAWKNIDALAQRAMPDTGEALPASENGTFDVDPNAIAQLSAEADKARAELRRLGYKDEDISKLVDYRLRQLNNERTAAALAQAQEFARTHPFAASAASVATNIGSGLGVLDAAVQRLRNPDRPYDYNSESMLASNWTNAVRNQVSQDIVSSANDRGRSGAVGNFLYQTGMSMADSLVNMGLAAVGMPEALGLTVLGGSAATASMREAHERGLSDAQALSIGLISGIAEYATERIGLDAFMETLTMKGANRATIVRSLMSNMLAEGGEEVLSDVVNFVADQIIAGDQSEFRKNIETYKTYGLSDAEALASAVKDQLGDTALSFLGGALSGGVMGAGGHIISGISNEQHNQMLVGAMSLEDNNPVKIAAAAVRDLNHQITLDMIQKGTNAPTEAQSKQLQEAYNTFEEALKQADTQTQKLVAEQGKKAYREQKQQYRADKKAIRQEMKFQKKISPTIMARVNEAVNSGSLQFSENATVQEAATIYARNRANVNQATDKILADPEAMQALNLSFPEGTNKPEQKRQARLALDALIQNAKASTAEQMQAEAQTAEAPAQTEAAEETESAESAAVSAETEEQAGVVQEAVESVEQEAEEAETEEAEDEEIDLADMELLTKEEHEELLRKQNPDLTQEQLDAEYDNMVRAHQDAVVRRDIQDRAGKMTMVEGRALSYRTFRSVAQQNAAAKGQTLEEDIIRRAFDTGAEETSEEVKKYEEERKADLEDTVKRINESSVLKNWGYTVRVSYDTEHDFVSKKVQENAFVSAKNKEIVFNGNRMDSGAMIMYVLGHEVTHKAAEVDKTLVKNIIDTFTELANEGKLNAQLTYKMRNIDAELENLRKLYQTHEDERAAAQNRKATTITIDGVREEFAADLMRDAFMQTKLYQEIVNKNADLAVKMQETLKRVLRAITGDGRKSRAVQKRLQKIADQMDAALEKIATDDSTLNKDAEDVTADNLTAKQLEEVKDTHGDEMFSLGTMKQDLDGYMQDLRDADLVGEGKVMTEEELTGLYNSINKVMDYVELYQEEIERSESYRNMTAENRPFSPYKDNSDPHYKKALDFSTLCRKRLLTQAITERLQNALKRALTPVEQVKIRNMIKELQKEYKHISVACALCYVEAARLKSPKVINEFLKNRSDTIWMFYSLKDSTFKHDVYEARRAEWKEQHGLDRKATNDTIKKDKKLWKEFEAFNMALRKSFPKWLQQNNPERYEQLTASVAAAEAMDASEFLSAQSLARMRQNETTRDVYDAFITKVREATRSKAQETDVPYARGDVNKVSDALIKQMNEESGFRHQSWSDFQAMHLLDTVAAIIELSTRKAKMHTYTKVADMVRLLGDTGLMINMSLIPSGQTGLDENGNLTWDPVEGFDYQEMLDLRKKFHATAGNIAIGISDEQILALMASPDIDYIIPYHTSGLSADMRNRMGIRKWQDYTKWQNEKGDDWEKKAPKLREWFDIKEALLAPDGVAYMVEASKKYLALCHERKLTPKFSQFLQKNSDGSYSLRDDAQNYWKLLIDRKMVDQYTGGIIQQKAVVPRFNEDTMLDILKNEVEGPAAREAREAEDYIVNKVLENGEGIVSKAERAQLENSARILRDAALRGAIENAAQEMGIGEDDRQFSIAYGNAASEEAQANLQQARDLWLDYLIGRNDMKSPVPYDVRKDIRDKTGWWMSPVDKTWRYWVPDYDAEWNRENKDLRTDTGEVYRLGDIMKHDRLYRDYPELKDVEVMFTLPPFSSTLGSYSPNENAIRLQEGVALNDRTFSTLLHEVQHAIQELERQKGADIQTGSDTIDGYHQALVAAYEHMANSGELDRLLLENHSLSSRIAALAERAAELFLNDPTARPEAQRQWFLDHGATDEDLIAWRKEALAERFGDMKLWDEEDLQSIVNAMAHEFYEEAVGEIDARLTESSYNPWHGQRGDESHRKAVERNLDRRVKYGEETRRGDWLQFHNDQRAWLRIMREFGATEDFLERHYPKEAVRQFSIAKAPGEETAIWIQDGKMLDSGEAVSFTDLILDGEKLGETRPLGTPKFRAGVWYGIAKNGRVVGRVKFGESKEITRSSPEYADAKIKGTDYDIPEGGSKLYFPIVAVEDWRADPKPTLRNSARYAIYQSGNVENQRQYSIAGTLAVNADQSKLAEAKQLLTEGKTTEQIWQETGWWYGKDGKWRFEIDDSEMGVVDETLASGDLSALITHDKLFDNYPFLRTVHFIKDYPDGHGANGEFDSPTMTIHLKETLSGEQLKKTLIHEIQHAVQMYERHARGSNGATSYKELFIRAVFDILKDPQLRKHFQSLSTYEEKVDYIEQVLAGGGRTYQDNKSFYIDLWKQVFAGYQRSVGEQEARNTADRLNLDEATRRSTPPFFADSGSLPSAALDQGFQDLHDALGKNPVDSVYAPGYTKINKIFGGGTFGDLEYTGDFDRTEAASTWSGEHNDTTRNPAVARYTDSGSSLSGGLPGNRSTESRGRGSALSIDALQQFVDELISANQLNTDTEASKNSGASSVEGGRQYSLEYHSAHNEQLSGEDNTGVELTPEQINLFSDGGLVDWNGNLVRVYRFERYGGATTMQLQRHKQVHAKVNAYYLTTSQDVAKGYQRGEITAKPTFSSVDELLDYLQKNDEKYTYAKKGNSLWRTEKATGELDTVLRYASETELLENAYTDILNNYTSDTTKLGTPEMLSGYVRMSNPWYVDADYKNWDAIMHPDIRGTYRQNIKQLRFDLSDLRKTLHEEAKKGNQWTLEALREWLSYYFPTGNVTIEEDRNQKKPLTLRVQYEWGKNDAWTIDIPISSEWSEDQERYIRLADNTAYAIREASNTLTRQVLRYTDELAEIARGRGYDSIILGNVTDPGGNTDIPADIFATDIIILDDSPNGAQFKLADNKNPTYGEDFRFSIENIDGETMAVTDFSGTPSTQVAAEKYLEGIVGSPEVFARTLDGATEVYLGEDLPKEYAFSKNSRLSNFFERMAKMKAVTVLDEMILLGENGRWSQNAKDHHGDEAKYGWTRYDTTFGLRTKKAVKVYDAVVLLRNDADGKTYLYDITNVKEKKTVPLDTATQERSAPNNVPAILGAEPSSKEQYTTDSEDVNRDFSLDLDDLDHDPVMQAFLDAYNPDMTATQKKAFYASLDKQIDKAQKVYEAALKQAEKHPATASDVGSIAQRKNAMIAWVIARQKFGTIKPSGENYRDVSVPARTAPNNRVSKTAATVMGAEATPEGRLKTIADAIVGGKLSYRPRTDPQAMIDARAKVARGFQEARISWAKAVAKGQVNKDLVAMGAVLLNNAGNSNASAEEYIDILTDYSDLLRRAGQALQAAKLLKRLSPEAQLYTAQRQVDKINEELRRKGIDPNKFKGVTIDQDLIKRYREAKTDEERKKIMKLIIENIAGQIPASGMDKFTAWRYLAMLGNFRTQVRNIAGNASMQFMRLLKADTAGLTEALIQRAGGNIERAQSVFRDKETWKAAKEEFSEVRDIILAGGKYDERRAFAREVEEARKIFKFKPLEKYRKLTGDVMDWGDAIFCSFTYRDALARYIKANGTTWSKASEELKDKAREFAIREAAEATYRDDNSFSNLIVGLRVHNPDNAAKKTLSVAVEGVLPFRKTPANILARTIEYSPVGLVYGAYNAAATRFGRKNVTGTDIVNQLAKGFSGTALIALGMMLTAKGMLVGKAPEDDKEKEAWLREGHQAYSLEIGGRSFTLDWMAPTCVPFFLGANFHDAFLEQGVTLETALDSLRTISDPILEMSMLQGIQNLIDNAANYGDDSALVRLTIDAAWNFVTQVVPTMLGQAERAFFDDNKRMTTYIDKNSAVPTEWQYKAGKASAKIPGVDYAQLVYTDAWGRMQTDFDSPTLHAVLQFFNPSYSSKIQTSPMEEELRRLYKATGEKKVLISSADKTISYTWEDAEGEKHQEKMNLTADEYFTYNTTRGRLAYSLMTEITNSQAYKNMSDSEKIKCVEYVYDYATQVGKGAVAKNFQAESWVDNAADAQKIGLSTSEFIAARAKYGTSYFTGKEYEGLKDAVKDGIKMEDYIKMHANVEKHFFSSYTQAEVKDYLQSADIPEDQKAVLWSQTLTSDAREKYDAAIEAGIKPEDYYNMRMKVDADESGSVTQAEAQAYLDSTSLSRAEKSTLWKLINKSWKKNPYA